MMMNKEPKEESINICKDLFIDFIIAYILINWLLAILLFFYEFLIVPTSNNPLFSGLIIPY